VVAGAVCAMLLASAPLSTLQADEPAFAPPRLVTDAEPAPPESPPARAPLAKIKTVQEQPAVRTAARAADAAQDDPNQLRKITSIRPFADYSPMGQPMVARKPDELKLSGGDFPQRDFASQDFRWKPTDLYHYPLYFEDAPLERYGHTHHRLLQPFVSAHRFGTQLIGLPYQMAIDPIRKKTYTLGWYRPGEPAPLLLYQVPWNAEAAAAQAGVMTGLFFLVP